jgi:hypothetical protein
MTPAQRVVGRAQADHPAADDNHALRVARGHGSADPAAQGVGGIEDQRRLGRHERAPPDHRDHRRALAVLGAVRDRLDRPLEDAAEDAFLPPGLAGPELAVGVKAGELRARAGAAGRAIVGAARAQDEVPAADPGRRRRREQLDMIDFGKRSLTARRTRTAKSVSAATFARVIS